MEPIIFGEYSVYFGESRYELLDNFIRKMGIKSVFVLLDVNSKACFLILRSKLTIDIDFKIIEIKSGEYHKNLESCRFIWEKLTYEGAHRKSVLINIGGGIITDMGGFAASVYNRGIDFINIPTTLLGMIDASIGGKTGVNLDSLKNQIGLFSNPKMVFIDFVYLKTLPEKERISGMAEIIKYGLIYDISLWNLFVDGTSQMDWSKIIHRSIKIKSEIVSKDRLETGLRKILNFGHTIGHAIESHFLNSPDKKNLTHGEAVAFGMITTSYISSRVLNFSKKDLEIIKKTIIGIYGKIILSKTDQDAIISLMKYDKKTFEKQIKFVLLKSFECCEVDCEVPLGCIVDSFAYYDI